MIAHLLTQTSRGLPTRSSNAAPLSPERRKSIVNRAVALTRKQSNIYQWGWQPEARFRVAVCGRRFGKTFLALDEVRRAYRLAVERKISPDNEIWYGAPTFKQAKRVFWAKLKRAFPNKWIAGKPNETECVITTKTGHVIRIVGLDNYDALRGSGLWFFIGDEWADAQPQCWTEAVRPMLSTTGGHALFIGTPKGYNHFYKFYNDGQGGDPEFKSFMYTTLDGGNVPQSEVDAAMRTLDKRTFQQEYCATFESYGGRVYYGFSRKLDVDDARATFDPAAPIHVGMDFNVNPMTATIWQERQTSEGKLLLAQVAELVIPTSNTQEMCNEIKHRYGRMGFSGEMEVKHVTIYPDPAGAQRRTSAVGKTDISILQENGFNVVALQSHPLVRDRINFVNGKFENALGERSIVVHSSCRFSIESYERLTFKEGTSEPDKTLTYEGREDMTLDHLPDAAGYYIFARFGQAKVRNLSVPHMGR